MENQNMDQIRLVGFYETILQLHNIKQNIFTQAKITQISVYFKIYSEKQKQLAINVNKAIF